MMPHSKEQIKEIEDGRSKEAFFPYDNQSIKGAL